MRYVNGVYYVTHGTQNIRIFVLIIVEPPLWRGYIGYASIAFYEPR